MPKSLAIDAQKSDHRCPKLRGRKSRIPRGLSIDAQKSGSGRGEDRGAADQGTGLTLRAVGAQVQPWLKNNFGVFTPTAFQHSGAGLRRSRYLECSIQYASTTLKELSPCYGRYNPFRVENSLRRLTQGRSLAATNPGLKDFTPSAYRSTTEA